MNPQRYNTIKQLFLEASVLDADAAESLLDQACQDDQELRDEVESLLFHHRTTTIIHASSDTLADGVIAPRLAAELQSKHGPTLNNHRPMFAVNDLVAGRYQILQLLGRGGMGEVYKANDLNLSQTVALKFLLPEYAADASALDQLRDEVAFARKVTHPNVTRVYDVSEFDAKAFISMEYIDGEDLQALVRRVGRLSDAKTVQIARQICGGLGAAHDRGVLHCDVKPANVLMDRDGMVHLVDFGIATLASSDDKPKRLIGTPAYMAPELFAGYPSTIQSDLYSLGIVLYETVTGQHPFETSSKRRDLAATPEPPSVVCPSVSPTLDRVILDCLEPNPRDRPQSAYAIMAQLPGVELSAFELSPGQTPSPSMIAATDDPGAISPKWCVTCCGIALLCLLAVVFLAEHTFLLPQAGLSKSHAVLVDRANEIVTSLGYTLPEQGFQSGFSIDRGYLDHFFRDKRQLTQGSLATGRPPAVFFWYRLGDKRLVAPAPLGESTLRKKKQALPGMITVRLDGSGRLLHFAAPPLQDDAAASPVDWEKVLAFADLDIADLDPVKSQRPPPMFADDRVAWTGVYPGGSRLPLHIESAAAGGKLCFFDVAPAWRSGSNPSDVGRSVPSQTFYARCIVYVFALIAAVFVAARNLRHGRSDRKGAGKLARLVFALGIAEWIFCGSHSADFVEEASSAYLWIARATMGAVTMWFFYIAIESHVRRYWPDSIRSWCRVITHRQWDALVGRDMLFGGLAGIIMVLVKQGDTLLPRWLAQPLPCPLLPGAGFELGEMLGLRYKIGILVEQLLVSISIGLLLLLIMLVFRIALKQKKVAALLFWAVVTLLHVVSTDYDTFLPWLTSGLLAAGVVLVLTRIGLLALIVALFVKSILLSSPLTLNSTAWYFPTSSLAVAAVIALLCFGAWLGRANARISTVVNSPFASG